MAFRYTIVSEFLTKEECDIILNFSLKELQLVPSEIFNEYGLDGVHPKIKSSILSLLSKISIFIRKNE